MTRELNSRFLDGSNVLQVSLRPAYNPEIDIGFYLSNGKKIPITESIYNACTKCFYFRKSYCATLPIRGECSDRHRDDKNKVIFSLIESFE